MVYFTIYQSYKQKNLLLNQISSTMDPQEQASLRKLLAHLKDKIRNFCRVERHRKTRWLFKKLLQKFNKNPYLKVPFSSKSLSFDEFPKTLASTRNVSCPGFNAITYKVYNQCTQIRKFLFNIFCSCLKHSVVLLQWRQAMEHFILKTESPCSSNIKDFCPIALLNVERKLFFSLISKDWCTR